MNINLSRRSALTRIVAAPLAGLAFLGGWSFVGASIAWGYGGLPGGPLVVRCPGGFDPDSGLVIPCSYCPGDKECYRIAIYADDNQSVIIGYKYLCWKGNDGHIIPATQCVQMA